MISRDGFYDGVIVGAVVGLLFMIALCSGQP